MKILYMHAYTSGVILYYGNFMQPWQQSSRDKAPKECHQMRFVVSIIFHDSLALVLNKCIESKTTKQKYDKTSNYLGLICIFKHNTIQIT